MSGGRCLRSLFCAVFAAAAWSDPVLGAGGSQYLTHFRGGEREKREVKVLNSSSGFGLPNTFLTSFRIDRP